MEFKVKIEDWEAPRLIRVRENQIELQVVVCDDCSTCPGRLQQLLSRLRDWDDSKPKWSFVASFGGPVVKEIYREGKILQLEVAEIPDDIPAYLSSLFFALEFRLAKERMEERRVPSGDFLGLLD